MRSNGFLPIIVGTTLEIYECKVILFALDNLPIRKIFNIDVNISNNIFRSLLIIKSVSMGSLT